MTAAAGVAIGAGDGRLMPSGYVKLSSRDGAARSTVGRERLMGWIETERKPPATVIAFGSAAHAGSGIDEKISNTLPTIARMFFTIAVS